MEIKISGTGLSILIPVVISFIGGAYAVGQSINSAQVEHQKEIIEEYKNSSQLDAPNLISALRQSANALKLSATERHALDDAKTRVDEYARRIGVCEVKLKESEQKITQMTESSTKEQTQCAAQIQNLKSELESYVPETKDIKLKLGIAAELIRGKVMLGIGAIYNSRAVINVNSDTIFLNVGESTKIKSDRRDCDLWLTGVDEKAGEVIFKLNCPVERKLPSTSE
ncbi:MULTISPECIES: hypothetical protein [Enterobacter]|jgi:hypothetical protein|uniref:hypothetical protein n=1 Tax=Enterobacter TaxID=547 RepID=UPI0015E4EC73|nr:MULTISPECIES: hypothetical protein [Enterobacter]ELN9421166.1 hypothetical protein [Enterobacter ludwigii]MDH1544434.1 hypothetical protein [Enterobacter ludwigii]QLO89164.1 hypothetical protein HV340_11290 [Enterobacter sp. RHBSTW-00975]HDR2461591.1 hypothetical protein [Enterobacter ludwigii]